LLILRERQPLDIWATPYVLAAISRNPIFNVLAPDTVTRRALPLDAPFKPLPELSVRAHDLGGKPPLYLEPEQGLASRTGANVALHLHGKNEAASLAFVPSCADISPGIENVARAAVLFFDGTMHADDEMIRSGDGAKTSRRMGHMPMT